MYYDIWRHNHWSDVQLEPCAPYPWFSACSTYWEPRYSFNVLNISYKNKHRFYNRCKFGLSSEREREREREKRESSLYFRNLHVLFFSSMNSSCWNCTNYRACVVCEVDLFKTLYDLSVILNNFSIPSRAI